MNLPLGGTAIDTATTRGLASRRQDAITVLAGLWLIVELFSNGWAHHNFPDLETFFTPWHGVLYSGFIAASLWFLWLGRSGGLRWFEQLPRGYGPSATPVQSVRTCRS